MGSGAPSQGGVAVLPADNEHFERLRAAAEASGALVRSFGIGPVADMKLSAGGAATRFGPTEIVAKYMDPDTGTEERFSFVYVLPGKHQAMNAIAVLEVGRALNIHPSRVRHALELLAPVAGRGERAEYHRSGESIILVDESYNANPLSMAAALDAIYGATRPMTEVRRIAVLGDMRELGEASDQLHRELKGPVESAQITKVFACGPHMRALWDVLPDNIRGAYAEKSTDLIAPFLAAIQPGDVIMIKGSLGTRMAPVVEAVKKHLTEWADKK